MLLDSYSGFGATATLDMATAVVLFVSIENLRIVAHARKSCGQGSPPALSVRENAEIGFIASALATAVTEPIDVIRTRLMAQARDLSSNLQGTNVAEAPVNNRSTRSSLPKHFGYKGLFHGLQCSVTTEGLSSLYRGLLPRLLLKSLGGSIWYTTYNWVKAKMAPL